MSERGWFIAGFLAGVGACALTLVVILEVALYRAVQ